MTTSRSSQAASALWILLLTLASVGTTLVFKCATPFPALAALAAVHMRAKDGVSLALLAWAASQLVGFCWLDYPLAANSLGWGAVMGVAAVIGAFAAHWSAARAGAGLLAQLGLSFVVSFVAFKVMILFGTVVLDGGNAAFAPDVLLRQLVRNAAVLGGLLVLHRLLIGLGMPPVRTERALA